MIRVGSQTETAGARATGIVRRRAVVVAAALALVPLGLGACGGERPKIEAKPVTTKVANGPNSTAATTTTSTPLTDQAPSFANMLGYIATPSGPPEVHPEPDAASPRLDIRSTTEVGAPTTFAVIGDPENGAQAHPGWIKVLLPTRPNGGTGWVPATSVVLSKTPLRVFIDLAGRKLRVENAGAAVFEAPVAIGTAENPTPTGATFVTELIENENPGGTYGPFAFGLALHSDTLTEFVGGPGQVGIHGTNQPQLIGQRVSHGCIRLSNDNINKLVGLALPLGVPVFIT